MTKIVLETLICIKKQDWIGSDTCRLEITIDGTVQPPRRQTMTNGQTWALDQELTFQTGAEIKLWEQDPLGKDDLIGDVNIGLAPASHTTAALTGSNANYRLQYSVTTDTLTALEEAQQALNGFQSSTKPGVWSYIPKAGLIDDIRMTITNPYQVNQGMTPLCGPASILYQLAVKFPKRYVELCQSLYETGQYQARTKLIQPSQTLRQSRVRSDVTLADWMLMATLRDTENMIFPVQDTSSIFIMGFTRPWEMSGWTYELLNYDSASFDPLIFFGKCEAICKAQEIVNQGGVTFMMVQSALIGNAKPPFPYPDHWITFLGNLSIDDSVWKHQGGHVRFDVYSWGQRIHVDVDEKLFEDYTWGLVYGS